MGAGDSPASGEPVQLKCLFHIFFPVTLCESGGPQDGRAPGRYRAPVTTYATLPPQNVTPVSRSDTSHRRAAASVSRARGGMVASLG